MPPNLFIELIINNYIRNRVIALFTAARGWEP
jgi:hypothetical protein